MRISGKASMCGLFARTLAARSLNVVLILFHVWTGSGKLSGVGVC